MSAAMVISRANNLTCVIAVLAMTVTSAVGVATSGHTVLRTSRDIVPAKAENFRATWPMITKFSEQIALFRNPACRVNPRDAFDAKCDFSNSSCGVQEGGDGWGGHELCAHLMPSDGCVLVSYGLSDDVTFEQQMMQKYKCKGVGMDPTVDEPEDLHNSAVKFMKVGAPMFETRQWDTLSPPAALKLVSGANAHLNVLKMDCEGCEYAIPEHVRKEDPLFFHRVDQFVLEAHVDKRFMSTRRHADAFEELLALLDEAGLKLQYFHATGCGEDTPYNLVSHNLKRSSPQAPKTLHYPCREDLVSAGYPCMLTCQNLLFARTHQ